MGVARAPGSPGPRVYRPGLSNPDPNHPDEALALFRQNPSARARIRRPGAWRPVQDRLRGRCPCPRVGARAPAGRQAHPGVGAHPARLRTGHVAERPAGGRHGAAAFARWRGVRAHRPASVQARPHAAAWHVVVAADPGLARPPGALDRRCDDRLGGAGHPDAVLCLAGHRAAAKPCLSFGRCIIDSFGAPDSLRFATAPCHMTALKPDRA